ncbi:MAG: hypothetical protein HC794_01120 [Nitrospiraceae bacterium]|nr:hypothetical protein [Nitrospiraceae bacterium]
MSQSTLRCSRAAVAALAVSLLCPTLAFAAERSLSKSFPMPTDGVLRIANLAGIPMRVSIIRIDTNQGLVGYGEVRDGASATYGAPAQKPLDR